ncbi:PepSY-like domain-containing protein [Flavobacterium sp.]|uniref:PepSY-like domain-containing protein n=1 Tax=Flavobacterium sp. TaxID=239 RepID=UPI002FDAA156
MKTIFLAITIALSAVVTAQTETKSKTSKIPTVVTEAFAQEFPKRKAKWSAEDGGYEAEFKINGTETSAVYDKKGHRKELESAIKTNELPANALAYLKKKYPTGKITEASKITDDKNVITYEAEIKKDGKKFDVLLDSNGKFIKIVDGD